MLPDLLGLSILTLLLILVIYQTVISIQYLKYATFLGKNSPIANAKVPISVVICARNEAKNLLQNIPLIVNQKYYEFEILIVNDRSWDETKEVLEELEKKYACLRYIEVPDSDMYFQGKKFAQTLGIKAAKYEHMIFTDADCSPHSEYWLAAMSSPFSQNKSISLGYGGYRKKPGLLNLFARFETLNTGAHYLSRAFFNRAYMGVGRNLGYNKTLFFKHKGFYKHMHLPSGDDDLFINEAATSSNVGISFSKECITLSETKSTWTEWFFQKRRHYSSSGFYNSKSKIALAFNSFSRSGIYVLTVLFLALYIQWYWMALALLFLYISLRTLALSLVARSTYDRDVAHLFIILDLPSMIIQYALIAYNILVGKPKVWRRR